MNPELPLDIDHSCWRAVPTTKEGYAVKNIRARPPDSENTCPACCYLRGGEDAMRQAAPPSPLPEGLIAENYFRRTSMRVE